MPLTSDLSLDASKFHHSAISKKTHEFNDQLIHIMKEVPKWYEVGAVKYREMRWNGENRPVVIESGKNIKLPSREKGRDIPCRVFYPDQGTPKGLFYFIPGGGWVVESELSQDTMLKFLADKCQLTVLAVGYRLAPENPYPKGNEDCFDVCEYLIDNGEKEFGGPLLFMGGGSTGGHLSALTCFKMLETRPKFAFKGIVLYCGVYELSGWLPQLHHFDLPLILNREIMDKSVDAYVPNSTMKDRQDPWISPFFADLNKMKLPPALFQCGTLDCLLDDSVLMSVKWMASGAEAILKLYPGAPHGFPGSEERDKALEYTRVFITEKI